MGMRLGGLSSGGTGMAAVEVRLCSVMGPPHTGSPVRCRAEGASPVGVEAVVSFGSLRPAYWRCRLLRLVG